MANKIYLTGVRIWAKRKVLTHLKKVVRGQYVANRDNDNSQHFSGYFLAKSTAQISPNDGEKSHSPCEFPVHGGINAKNDGSHGIDGECQYVF